MGLQSDEKLDKEFESLYKSFQSSSDKAFEAFQLSLASFTILDEKQTQLTEKQQDELQSELSLQFFDKFLKFLDSQKKQLEKKDLAALLVSIIFLFDDDSNGKEKATRALAECIFSHSGENKALGNNVHDFLSALSDSYLDYLTKLRRIDNAKSLAMELEANIKETIKQLEIKQVYSLMDEANAVVKNDSRLTPIVKKTKSTAATLKSLASETGSKIKLFSATKQEEASLGEAKKSAEINIEEIPVKNSTKTNIDLDNKNSEPPLIKAGGIRR